MTRLATRPCILRKSGAALAGVGLTLTVIAMSAVFPERAKAGPLSGIGDLVGKVKDAVDPTKVGASVLKDALEWLLGGIEAKVTLEVIRFLVAIELPVGGSLKAVTGPMIVIGGFFLVVGLITSVGDGYREVIVGTDTAARVIGQAIFRVIGLALLMGSWYWLVPLVVDVANGMSGYVLSDQAVTKALGRTFISGEMGAPLLAAWPLLGLLIGVGVAMTLLVLIVLKFVLVIAFACLYVGGPAFIGFGALPKVGPPLVGMVLRALFTLMLIPLAWAIVFVAWAGVNAALLEDIPEDKFVTVLTGPGLFLAGLVVLLAVTKRLLSLASSGLRLSVPGSGLARIAMSLAVYRGLGGALKGAGGQAASQSAGATAPVKAYPGDGQHQAELSQLRGSAGTARNPQPAAPGKTKYGRDLVPGGAPGVSSAQQRARDQAAEQVRGWHESLGKSRGDGAQWKPNVGGAATRQEVAELKDRVGEIQAVLGGPVPREQVLEDSRHVPPIERARFFGGARAAQEAADGDAVRAGQLFQDAGTRAWGGRMPDDPLERQGVESLLATDVGTLMEVTAPDARAWGYRPAPGVTPEGRFKGFATEAFAFGRASQQDESLLSGTWWGGGAPPGPGGDESNRSGGDRGS